MSEWMVALLREAYERVPNLEDRAAYCMARQKQFFAGTHTEGPPVLSRATRGPVPFRQEAEPDPVMARLCGEDK